MAARAYIGGEGPYRPPNGRQAPVTPGVGDRPLSPVGGGATGPIAFFFAQGPRCEFEKKITLRACRPMGATGGIFKILIFFKI